MKLSRDRSFPHGDRHTGVLRLWGSLKDLRGLNKDSGRIRQAVYRRLKPETVLSAWRND